MGDEHTTAVVQRYLDESAGGGPAEPVVRALVDRAVRRLHQLCAAVRPTAGGLSSSGDETRAGCARVIALEDGELPGALADAEVPHGRVSSIELGTAPCQHAGRIPSPSITVARSLASERTAALRGGGSSKPVPAVALVTC